MMLSYFSFVNSKKIKLSEIVEDEEGQVVMVSFSHGLHPPVDSEIWETQVTFLKISSQRNYTFIMAQQRALFSIIYFQGSFLSSSC